jgi:hypothetical protein
MNDRACTVERHSIRGPMGSKWVSFQEIVALNTAISPTRRTLPVEAGI